jgi:hypothetical protein
MLQERLHFYVINLQIVASLSVNSSKVSSMVVTSSTQATEIRDYKTDPTADTGRQRFYVFFLKIAQFIVPQTIPSRRLPRSHLHSTYIGGVSPPVSILRLSLSSFLCSQPTIYYLAIAIIANH